MASTKTKLKERLDTKVQTLQLVPSEDKAVTLIETSIAPVASNYIALTTNVMDIITENLKNQPLSYQLFDVIKSPSGGSTVFTVPTLSGEEIQKELSGIIIDYTTPRAYWETSDPVEGTPPNCYSRDSIVSHDGKPYVARRNAAHGPAQKISGESALYLALARACQFFKAAFFGHNISVHKSIP